MIQIILAIHLIIAIALVGVVMLQRSEGGGLGIGGRDCGPVAPSGLYLGCRDFCSRFGDQRYP